MMVLPLLLLLFFTEMGDVDAAEASALSEVRRRPFEPSYGQKNDTPVQPQPPSCPNATQSPTARRSGASGQPRVATASWLGHPRNTGPWLNSSQSNLQRCWP